MRLENSAESGTIPGWDIWETHIQQDGRRGWWEEEEARKQERRERRNYTWLANLLKSVIEVAGSVGDGISDCLVDCLSGSGEDTFHGGEYWGEEWPGKRELQEDREQQQQRHQQYEREKRQGVRTWRKERKREEMLRQQQMRKSDLGGVQPTLNIKHSSRSEADFLLCRKWIRKCNRRHNHIDSYVARLPTRVVDVEDNLDSNFVRLRTTNERERGIYIALSHRWQVNTPKAMTDNINDWKNGMKLDILPQTYQDAIHLTRKLGIRFLWIDSLCILQDTLEDWETESGKMESVFASAYCTIAASPASAAHGNFRQDVEEGELSQRGWILQERALSRRIIHLTGEQIYWECGSVILSKATSKGMNPKDILGSSEFPKLALPNDPKAGPAIFQDMFTRYSRLGLTVDSDRPAAISGLEWRLMTYYHTTSFYGIVKSFFGESLLWQRSGDKWMEPLIDFKDEALLWSINGKRVPSWSWMAYKGEIKYGNTCIDDLSWNTDFSFRYIHPQGFLSAPLVRISSKCRIKLYGNTECEIRDENNDAVGWIRYDCWGEGDVDCLGCISLAILKLLSGSFNYVLLITPVGEREGKIKKYRRLGVAVILDEYLHRNGDIVEVY
jgi:hypothetical protein